jgi:hypothetical protein
VDATIKNSMRRIRFVLGAIVGLSATSAAAEEEPAAIRYCHGFGCKMNATVRFSSVDMAELKSIVEAGQSSPEAEREALGKADQWYERLAGAASGTSTDKPKGGFSDVYNPSQLDCIDESRNTTTLLKLIETRGWLSHHKVGKPKVRGFLVDLRYPHNTATVIEKESGEAWAIDSWIPANAEFPDIMPLKIWKTKGVLGRN